MVLARLSWHEFQRGIVERSLRSACVLQAVPVSVRRFAISKYRRQSGHRGRTQEAAQLNRGLPLFFSKVQVEAAGAVPRRSPLPTTNRAGARVPPTDRAISGA